ncbi:DgyrCDS12721 [Dimorphilus gyrociliatus]|uniref:GPI inositol-deacylase n=1 Tax=Dimorphilus gyrociliatus TaxID=2664684 RepID=A0A7I8W7B7_9ANNE|nr:DgyrCDS12721 [Dimorphilus gyrociliatus]
MAVGAFRPGTFIIILSLAFIGLYDYLLNYESNNCQMTYMFEYPEYLPIPMTDDIKERFPTYGLYLYGEGDYAREHRNFRMSGIPVLFIPGNDGSHKQVRSLGSVAYRKWLDESLPFHFDFYSVDFNEELSAFVGDALQRQTAFTEAAINKILSLYTSTKSVVLVGHSMGGMVARALFTIPGFQNEKVHTIFTQATPHQMPVIALDYELAEFYRRVNEFWTNKSNSTLLKTSVFSTAGGFRDIQVRRDLVSLRGLVAFDTSWDTNTKSVPRGWVSTDHRCHVWCKQIVLATVRAMIDMVDKKTKKFAVNPVFKRKVILHHFYKNSGSKTYRQNYNRLIELGANVKTEMRPKSSWRYNRKEVNVNRYFATKITQKASFIILTQNLKAKNYLGGCLLDSSCDKLENLSPYAELVPSNELKVIKLNSDEIAKFSSIVTIIPKASRDVHVYAEAFNPDKRSVVWSLPKAFVPLISTFFSYQTLVEKTEKNAIFYNLTLTSIDHIMNVYKIYITTLNCNNADDRNVLSKIHIPWISDDSYDELEKDANSTITVRLPVSKPPQWNLSAQVHLYLNPQCEYTIGIQLAFVELLGQFFRFYTVNCLSAMIAILSFLIADECRRLCQPSSQEKPLKSYNWPHFLKILPITFVANWTLGTKDSRELFQKISIPPPDSFDMDERGLWFTALFMYNFLLGTAILSCTFFIASNCLEIFSWIVRKFSGLIGHNKIDSFIWYLVIVTHFISVPIAAFTCGSLGVLITVTSLLLRHIFCRENRDVAEDIKRHKLRILLIYMLVIISLLTSPSLIHLVRGIFGTVDPWRTPCVAVCVSVSLLVWADLPSLKGPLSGEFIDIASGLFYIGGHIIFIYGLASLYRITNILSVLFTIFALLGILARFLESAENQKTKIKED